MKNLFVFNVMFTPKIIIFVYWFLLLAAVVFGWGMMSMPMGFRSFSILIGLAIIAVGAIGARILCELLLVLFRINENIKTLADHSTSGDKS